MAASGDSTERPLHAAMFMLAGGLTGLAGGGVGGLLSWSLISSSDDFLRSLHPKISGSTDYFLGLFFFNVMIIPLVLAALGGIVLPAGYALAKGNRRRSMKLVNWLIGMLCLATILLVLAFFGAEKWYLLVAMELPAVLGLTAALTVMMIRLFNEQLSKVA